MDLLTANPDVLKKPELLVGDFKETGGRVDASVLHSNSKVLPSNDGFRQQILERLANEGLRIALPRIRVLD